MPAAAIRHEIQEVVRLGAGHRLQRCAPGARDRPRRQAADAIGVEGVLAIEVGAADRAIHRRAAGRGIGDGRVGLQRHVAAQAIDEDTGDARTFLGLAGLALDDRGQHQRLARGGQRQVGRARRPGLGQRAVHRGVGAAQDGRARLAVLEGVGLGQDVALAEGRGFAGETLGALEQGADLVGGQALGDGQAPLHGPRLAQDAQHLVERGAGGKGEFRGAQRALGARQPGGEREGARVADDAAFGQRAGDPLGAAARDDELGRFRERTGCGVGVPGIAGAAGKHGQDQHEGEQSLHSRIPEPNAHSIAACRHPKAQLRDRTKPSVAQGAPTHGTKASRPDGRSLPCEGREKRIAVSRDPGARLRDRAQTISRAGRASARREGKGRGCGPPAV